MTPTSAAAVAGVASMFAAVLVMHVFRSLQLWPMCEHGLSAHGNPFVSC